MSNEEYLASGILELYAAGGLSQAEREEVELRAANSPEVRAALDEACAAMETYAQLHAVAPRPYLKDKIMAQVQETNPVAATPEQNSEAAVYSLPPAEETSPYKWMFAASIALFLISGLLSYHFYNKWQQTEDLLATARASEQLMAQNVQTTSLRSEQLQETLAILRNPDYQPVELEGVETHPDANMLVYWNPQNQEVYIDELTLPAPPTGMQYQLWALDNGNPVDAGMISLAGTTTAKLQKMKQISSAQAFAVTLEPMGGSVNPTLEQLMVMGKVKS
ncbi:anti-sigma factor [uncultured Pontibacter sp.]|uniref:anti-sigma factor n=1 Tax=uncultured Pontibacter sp. TaxID=453356 RepID=UPI0026073EFA|nr:anti-sigma factor [uncultured Pontibacter sp.]